MKTFNADEVEKGIVRTVRSVVGHRLATDPVSGQELVIREFTVDNANDKGQKPDHPFITVGLESVGQYQGWLLDEYVDDDGYPVYVIQLRLFAIVTAFGRGALDIMTELKHRFQIPSNRSRLYSESGAKLVESEAIPDRHDFLTTDFEPYATMVLTLDYISELVDKDGSSIEKVEAEGVIIHEIGDPAPETIYIYEPQET